MTHNRLQFLLSELEEVIESDADFLPSEIDNLALEKLFQISNDLQSELKSKNKKPRMEIEKHKRGHLLETFVRQTPAAVAMLDRELNYLLVSDRWKAYFQLEERDIQEGNYYEIFPDFPPDWQQQDRDCLLGNVEIVEREGNYYVSYRCETDWLHWEVSSWRDATGQIAGLLVSCEIYTEQNLLQKKIESCEAQMRSMFAGMNELALTVEIDSDVILFLPTKFFECHSDITVNQIIEKTYNLLSGGASAREYRNIVRRVLQTKTAIEFEYSLQLENSLIWYSAKISPTSDTSVIWVARDITNNKETAENKLFIEKELAQVTLASIGDGVISTNASGSIEYMNPIAEKLTGWQLTEAKGNSLANIFQIVKESSREPIVNPIERVSQRDRACQLSGKNLLIDRLGNEYAIEGLASPMKTRQGELFGVVIVFRDVTQARDTAQKLLWQATRDPLTKLYNRRKFEEKVTQAIDKAKNSDRNYVLCYIDLDRFKIVNDTCGHTAGDELLIQITQLLQQKVRTSDVFARIGGDEFGLLLSRCSFEKARKIAEGLVASVREFRFVWEDKIFRIGASIGLVAISRHSESLADLIGTVDAACYAAKKEGGNCVHLYHDRDLAVVKQQGERQWIEKLHRALEKSNFLDAGAASKKLPRLREEPISNSGSYRFCLYAQKIVSLENTEDNHYEVLLRLIDAGGTVIPPGLFLPAAERYGLMPAIDRWVISNFFAGYETYCQSQPDKSLSNIYTINLSGASINNRNFDNFLQQQFIKYAIPPETICFEITETVAIANIQEAAASIDRLKKLGCSIALDDFGSGMSSFNYLKNLPVDYLKIDGSFIKNMLDDEIDRATVECFQHLSKIMNIKTIAEFVENNAISRELKQIGIHYAQGYGIEKPRPLVWNI